MAEPTAGGQFPTVDPRTLSEAAPTPTPNSRALPLVPGYQILAQLAKGGMGIVYKARQVGLKRLVALKMIRSGEDATPAQIARFHAEAENVARLQHPNIVQIHEHAEAPDGRPYFSMEYMPGGSLQKHFNGRPQPARQAAQLLKILAEAVHYAHQNNIVHRDLKPSNVLLMRVPGSGTSGDSQEPREGANAANDAGTPAGGLEVLDLAQWMPKISDFGLAKNLTEDSGPTRSGELVGTPEYMAPEQIPGGNREIKPVTDVYALGGILYWALTGGPPFRGENILHTLDQVRTKEPIPPSRLYLKVHRDLETICLKCLQKDPAKRYPSAESLAEDLGRFLRNEPIEAFPVSAWEKTWRWCRRNPRLATWIGLAVFFLLAGSSISVFFGLKAERKATEAGENLAKAEEANRMSERRRYGLEMRLAQQAWTNAEIALVHQRLLAQQQINPALCGFEWHYLQRLLQMELHTLRAHNASVDTVSFSPDGRILASAGEDGLIKIWDIKTWQEIRTIPDGSPCVRSVAFSPDGRFLASASFDNMVKLWDVSTGQPVRKFEGNQSKVNGVAFSPDGNKVASAGSDRSVRIWETASGKALFRLTRHEGFVRNVAFSSSGSLLASAGDDGTIIWDAQSGQYLSKTAGNGDLAGTVAFSPDEKSIATAGPDHTVRIWNPRTLQEKQPLRGHTDHVRSVAYSPDGARIVSAGQDNTIRVWDAQTGGLLLVLRGHQHHVNSVAFSPDGRRVATASGDRTVKIWDSTTSEEALSLLGHTRFPSADLSNRSVTRVRFSPDGQVLASASSDRTVKLWSTSTGQEKNTLRGHGGVVLCIAFSADGLLLASGSDDREVKIWDVTTGHERTTLLGHAGAIVAVAFSPDARQVFSVAKDGEILTWDVASSARTAVVRLDGKAEVAAISRDGRLAATHDSHDTVRIWDTVTGQRLQSLAGHRDVRCLAFSPDSKLLATHGTDPNTKGFAPLVWVWSVTSGQRVAAFQGHTCDIDSVEFSADGERLISTSSCDYTARIWDVTTRQEVMTLPCKPGALHAVMSPDGLQLAAAANDGTVKIWDARLMSPEIEVQREARSAVDFLVRQKVPAVEVASRISADPTIGEEARRQALRLTGPHGERLVESEARRIVAGLFAGPLLRKEVIESIERHPNIGDSIQQRCLELARDYPEDLDGILGDVLSAVLIPGANAQQCELALRRAKALHGLKPEDPYIETVLSMAQYRVGKFQDAISTFNRAHRSDSKDRVGPNDRTLVEVEQLAFLAMAQHQGGQMMQARQTFDHLRDVMNQPMQRGQDRIARGLFKEAEKVLGSAEPPVPKAK